MKKLFLFTLFLFPLVSHANDTSGYILPTGGVTFEKQDGIKMQVEALYIRPHQIEVNYLFSNTTDKDITTRMFFPLPPISAVLDYYGYDADAAHQFNFKLWINGKEKNYQTHFSLNQGERPVPNVALQLWNSPEEYIDENSFHERVSNMPKQDRQLLIEGHYLKWDWTFLKNSETHQCEEHEGWTMTVSDNLSWKKQISYSWEQTFPAHKTVFIRHTHVPAAISNNVGSPFSKCINEKAEPYKSFVYIPEEENVYPISHLQARNYLEYILTTANNWQGPIENFNLLVQSPFKSVGYLDGKAFYGEQYYAVNRQNYTPRWDLSAEFLVKGELANHKTKQTTPTLYRVNGPANLRDVPNGRIISQLSDKTYVWAWPEERQGKWYPVRQNDLSGYTHTQNLIKVF